ncbi:hypothetical protein [uncultured Erythrobacter sp.]|uniref:hypothetical protein n=1 Tax=uncultured Erythrobacter sp. TaxID=263913 RepID=UPI00262ACCBB|nr:hypothetical protein [uncultured Erythrobacter sp.]
MMTGSPLWTGSLLNFGMVGLAIEPPLRRFLFRPNSAQGYVSDNARMSLFWMLIPLAYAGWYGVSVYKDRAALEKIRAEFDAINASVNIPFDPKIHDLVFVGTGASVGPEHGLPTVFTQSDNSPSGYDASSLLEKEVCDEIKSNDLFASLSIRTFGFRVSDSVSSLGVRGRISADFCLLATKDKPTKQVVSVKKTSNKVKVYGLPVTLTKTIVTMPSGEQFTLRGGVAAPYPKYPTPIAGCALNSGGPSWECGGGFLRDTATPVISGGGKFGRDGEALANALALEKIAPDQLRAIDPKILRLRMRETIVAQLEKELTYVRAIIADPSAEPREGSTRTLEHSPNHLVELAPEIVTAIKRASGPHPDGMEGINRARRGGWILAHLFGNLPLEEQEKYAEEIADIYLKLDTAGDGRHWLYEVGSLMRFRKPLPVQYAPPSLTAE